jgi:hypothetical protein
VFIGSSVDLSSIIEHKYNSIKAYNITNKYSIMKQLTYAEIELLQYTLKVYSFETGDDSLEIISLKNKLIAMRSQLESPKYYKELSEEEINNSL